MNFAAMEEKLAQFPLFSYHFFDPRELEFTQRIRHICRQECPMYGKSWACPPAVGDVETCRDKCLQYSQCLIIVTMTEVSDIANVPEALATRPEHEAITNQIRDLFLEEGIGSWEIEFVDSKQILRREFTYTLEEDALRLVYVDGTEQRFTVSFQEGNLNLTGVDNYTLRRVSE